MKDNKLVNINFIYSNNKGTEVFGQMLVPLVDGKIYKALRVTINSGFIDKAHQNLNGENGKIYRQIKNELISKFTEKTNDDEIVKVVDSFNLINEKNIGYVKAISIINGYSSNREGKLSIDEPGCLSDGKLIAKLFQNAKSAPIKTNENWKIISLQTAETKYHEYFEKLLSLYNKNIDSCSTEEVDLEGK